MFPSPLPEGRHLTARTLRGATTPACLDSLSVAAGLFLLLSWTLLPTPLLCRESSSCLERVDLR